jgi:UDPglucose 6-dehydrogenase
MIGFAGLSHLGLVSATAAASKGFDVAAFDPDPALVARLERGELPVFEPGLDDLRVEAGRRLTFTDDARALAACDLVVFARDVATDDQGRSDLGPLRTLIDAALPHTRPGATLVVLSQVPPGFTRRLAAETGVRPVRWYYQVETLVFGRAVERATSPERFIVGCGDPAEPLPAPYRDFLAAFGCPVLSMRYESAELTKIAINMCLVASVTVANTMGELCEKAGADWSEVVPALRLDRRIGPHAYLSPGLGLSGGNLERDLATVRALAAEHGTEAGVVAAWVADSTYRRGWALRTLQSEVLAGIPEPTVALWGLAYKPGTHSTRNSPALALLDALRHCPVRVYDPQVILEREMYPNVVQTGDPLDACLGADALVVATPWEAFSSVDPRRIPQALRGRVVIDPFGALDLRGTGLTHYRLGRPAVREELAG